MDFESVVRDINEKLAALGKPLTAEEVNVLVETQMRSLLEGDSEFVRKMRFGPSNEPELRGTKYARLGLTVADVEFLYTLQYGLKGLRKVDGSGVYKGPSEELTRTFAALRGVALTDTQDLKMQDEQALELVFSRAPSAWFHGKDRELVEQGAWGRTEAFRKSLRAMDTAESGFGSQLVGAQYVGELWEAARRESRVFNLIDSFNMTAPTAYLPVEVDIPEMLFVAESTANNSSNYTTVKTGSQRVAVDAKKFVIHQMWSGEMEEDSIIPFLLFIRRQASLSVAHYSDSLALNGDTTNAGTGNINLDDADPADTKHYLAFDGIRHAALVDNTANAADAAGGVSLALLNAQRGLMIDTARFVDWGHPTSPADVVYVADPATADSIALLDEVTTVDKYGPQATVLTGEVGRILGHSLISSIAVSKTEADGKVSTTGSNNVKGQVVTFNRRGFKVGWRRRVQIETERIPATDQTRIVYSLRLGFGRFTPSGAASGIEAAAVLYDIAL